MQVAQMVTKSRAWAVWVEAVAVLLATMKKEKIELLPTGVTHRERDLHLVKIEVVDLAEEEEEIEVVTGETGWIEVYHSSK